MVSTRTVVLCALVAAISSAAYAGSKGKDEGVREARAAIEAANAKFSEPSPAATLRLSPRCIHPTRSRFRQTVR
jgi:hypothetical protein